MARKGFLPVGVLNKIEGYIDREEGDRLAMYAAKVPADQAIVEIGSASGAGACYLAAGSRAGLGAHVYCIDPYEDGDGPEYFRNALARDMLIERARFVEVSDRITVIERRSQDVAPGWGPDGDGPSMAIGLLHIDGRHDYAGASEDFRLWAPLVAEGGYVIMHDLFGRKAGEVERVVNEVVMPGRHFTEIGRYRWSQSPRRRGQWVGQKR